MASHQLDVDSALTTNNTVLKQGGNIQQELHLHCMFFTMFKVFIYVSWKNSVLLKQQLESTTEL